MALTEKDRHLSAYVNMTSDQAVADFLHHRNLVRGISVATVLVLVAVLFWTMTRTAVNLLPAFIVAYLIILVTEVLEIRKGWVGLLGILSYDRDPQKLLEVVSPLVDRFSSKKRISTMLETWYGLCSVLLGYPDVALAWAEKASRRGPNDAYWISILGVRASAFSMLDDEASLLATRAQLEKLLENNASKATLAKAARLSLDSVDETLAERRGDWTTALQKIGAIDALITTPQQEVVNVLRKARVCAGQGDMANAAQCYAFVAANGGTCAFRADAQRWLEANGYAPAPAVGRE
jgi:hypothetical protein